MTFRKVKSFSYGEENKDIKQCDAHAKLLFCGVRDILSSLLLPRQFHGSIESVILVLKAFFLIGYLGVVSNILFISEYVNVSYWTVQCEVY